MVQYNIYYSIAMAEKPDAVPINHDQDTTLEDAFGNSTSSVVSDSALKEFLDVNINAGRFICVVTSGGTQIALEQRAVRTLENFSTGLRGALMTEELLQETNLRPYGVVLLVRKGAVLPYARNFSVDTFSEALAFSATAVGVELYNRRAKESCKRLREVINEKRIFVAEYTTVQEYLFSLKHIARRCMPLKERAMFCLAAAVSDFYIPPSELSGHKLEAVDGILTLRLHQVPKCLGLLSSNWAPNAFIVSFKVSNDRRTL